MTKPQVSLLQNKEDKGTKRNTQLKALVHASCMKLSLTHINQIVIIIGASLSEPHIYMWLGDFVCIYIFIVRHSV